MRAEWWSAGAMIVRTPWRASSHIAHTVHIWWFNLSYICALCRGAGAICACMKGRAATKGEEVRREGLTDWRLGRRQEEANLYHIYIAMCGNMKRKRTYCTMMCMSRIEKQKTPFAPWSGVCRHPRTMISVLRSRLSSLSVVKIPTQTLISRFSCILIYSIACHLLRSCLVDATCVLNYTLGSCSYMD